MQKKVYTLAWNKCYHEIGPIRINFRLVLMIAYFKYIKCQMLSCEKYCENNNIFNNCNCNSIMKHCILGHNIAPSKPHLRLAEIQMHPVVGDRNELKVKVAHSVDLELECQRWLQVAIYAILLELK